MLNYAHMRVRYFDIVYIRLKKIIYLLQGIKVYVVLRIEVFNVEPLLSPPPPPPLVTICTSRLQSKSHRCI
jgi:hypothetical protein